MSRTERLVLAAVVIFHVLFIARLGVEIAGKAYFVLFDDAMISMTYARNLAKGAGLVWHPNAPRVEGFSNPAWTAILAAIHALGAPDRLASLCAMMLGSGILVAQLLVVRALTRIAWPTDETAPALAMALAGFAYANTFWTLRGMEVGLVGLLASAGLLALFRGGRAAAPMLFIIGALLALTRMDGVLPALVLGASAFAMQRRALSLAPAIGALIGLVAWTIFRHEYYGEWLPNTYYLKMTGSPSSARWLRGAGALFAALWQHMWLPVAILVACVIRGRHARESFGVPEAAAAMLAVQCAYSIHVGGDAWEGFQFDNRFLAFAMITVTIPVAGESLRAVREWRDEPASRRGIALMLAIAAAIALAGAGARVLSVRDLAPTIAGRWHLWQLLVGGVALAAAAIVAAMSTRLASALVQLADRPSFTSWLRENTAPTLRAPLFLVVFLAIWLPTNGSVFARWVAANAQPESAEPDMLRLALLLRAATPPDATIAVIWAGTIPYFSHRRCLDVLGKCDPVIARLADRPGENVPGHTKWNLQHTIGELRPTIAAQLPHVAKSDLDYMLAEGYVWLPNTLFIQRADRTLDRRKLSTDWTVDAELNAVLRASEPQP